ncbi:MAG: hypothetical protein NC253_13700 [Ruminococcus sp.]|nr:hypothetical protein [Ruminococcus sp.]MCM1382844.1 hypothetical protein [Muribaculaceae bacterium]MCM1480521.1 hypothetical protein [Muribaculaceae bacterium]
MAIISIILMALGFFGYIICLTVDTHFAYKAAPPKEREKADRTAKTAWAVSRLCLAAFIFGLVMFSYSFGQ